MNAAVGGTCSHSANYHRVPRPASQGRHIDFPAAVHAGQESSRLLLQRKASAHESHTPSVYPSSLPGWGYKRQTPFLQGVGSCGAICAPEPTGHQSGVRLHLTHTCAGLLPLPSHSLLASLPSSQVFIENRPWFKIGKGILQSCILSPFLFNFYAEYIMRNARLDELQAGIKIIGRNIKNLRYADDSTLMAESEGELKSLLMKVKE